MEQRIKHAEHVGSVLTAALRSIEARKTKTEKRKATLASCRVVSRNPNRIPLRVGMARKNLQARGAGVYEDQKNGDIWHREGDFLVRQQIDIDSIVSNYLETCQGS